MDSSDSVPSDGIPVFVRERLVRILGAAGATVTRSRMPLSGGLRIKLGRGEMWLDYLDRPLAWVPADLESRSPP